MRNKNGVLEAGEQLFSGMEVSNSRFFPSIGSLVNSLPYMMSVLFLTASLQAQGSTALPCRGDLNLDGTRGLGDLALLSAHLSGKQLLEEQVLSNADVNLDRIIDVGDMARLLQHTTGEYPLIPCGEFSPQEVACPDLQLEGTSAAPMESLSIGILPEEFSELTAAIVMDPDDELGIITLIERDEDGSLSLFTPFYPGLTLEGGPVTIQITDGSISCPSIPFTIDSIPPAPGEFSRVVDSLQATIQSTASNLGLTQDDLLSGAIDLSPYAIPLSLAQALVDDPDNPDSLRAVSNGTAPVLGEDSDVAFLDGVVSRIKLVDLLEVFNESADSSSSIRSIQTAPQTASTELSPQFESSFCAGSAAALSYCMNEAIKARETDGSDLSFWGERGPAERKVAEDFRKAYSVLEKVVTKATKTGLPLKVIKKVLKQRAEFQNVSRALEVRRFVREAMASLLPSRLVRFDVNLNPSVMEEDLDHGFFDLPLTAASLGWKLDARRIVEEVFKSLNVDKRLERAYITLMREIAESDLFLGREITTQELENSLIDQVVGIAGEIAPGSVNGSILEVEPRLFGPVFLDSETEFREIKVIGSAIELTNQLTSDRYRPLEEGLAHIVARVRTDGGRFGGVDPISTIEPVEVKPIEISILLNGQSVTQVPAIPGETLTFTVKVENSAFPDKIELVDAPQGAQLTINTGSNTHTLVYTAPIPPKLSPDYLRVRHTATTGACREVPGCGRSALVVVQTPRVNVFPFSECVEPGGSQTFTAEVIGANNQSVTWQASSGDIGLESGEFRAPGQPTVVKITATSVAIPDLKGEALIKVGGCDCWWTVSVDGNLVNGEPGVAGGSFLTSPEGFFTVILSTPLQVLTITPDPSLSLFAVAGNLGLSEPDVGYGSTEETLPGAFFELTDTVVNASVSGNVTIATVTSSGPEERLAPFSVRFKVTSDPQNPFANACLVK